MIPGKSVDVQRFAAFQPCEVLYEFDGPRIFTLRDADADLHLAYWCDAEGDMTRYVVVPTLHRIVESLRAGTLSVWEALDQPRCWLCDVDVKGVLRACLSVDFRDIPADALPLPHTKLWPELEQQPIQVQTAGDRVRGRTQR